MCDSNIDMTVLLFTVSNMSNDRKEKLVVVLTAGNVVMIMAMTNDNENMMETATTIWLWHGCMAI